MGETLAQTVKRYGDPIRKSKTGEVAMFKKTPYYITMHFWNGKADAMTYVRTKPNGEAAALSSHEIDSLLDLNSGDGNWKPVKEGSNTWKTDDASRQATYTKSDFLVITVATYSKHLSENTSAEEPAKSARSKSTTSESSPSHRAKKSGQADESEHSTPKKHLAKEPGSTKKPAGSNRESSEDESPHHRVSKKDSSGGKKSQTDQEPAKSGRHKKSGNLTKNASSKDDSDQPAKKRHPSKGESHETGN